MGVLEKHQHSARLDHFWITETESPGPWRCLGHKQITLGKITSPPCTPISLCKTKAPTPSQRAAGAPKAGRGCGAEAELGATWSYEQDPRGPGLFTEKGCCPWCS